MNFNLIDLAIIGVIVVFALIGWYRGFLSSLMHAASALGALLVSGIGYRQLARFLIGKFDALQFVLQFTDSAEAIGNIELSELYGAFDRKKRAVAGVFQRRACNDRGIF